MHSSFTKYTKCTLCCAFAFSYVFQYVFAPNEMLLTIHCVGLFLIPIFWNIIWENERLKCITGGRAVLEVGSHCYARLWSVPLLSSFIFIYSFKHAMWNYQIPRCEALPFSCRAEQTSCVIQCLFSLLTLNRLGVQIAPNYDQKVLSVRRQIHTPSGNTSPLFVSIVVSH